MLQRITVKVTMKKEKDRSKAMKVAVGVKGVISVKIGGDDNNTMTVIGNEIDAVNLSRSLGKKFGSGSATLVRVEPVVKVYGFDQDHHHQGAATVIYQGQPAAADNYNNNFSQVPMNFYNSPLPQYQTQYYYPYDKPGDSGCSIM